MPSTSAAISPISSDAMRVKSAKFLENGAGTYNFDVLIPAGAVIHNIMIAGEALWAAATSAVLNVGDYAVGALVDGSLPIGSAISSNGFFTAVNLKATDLTQGQHIDFNRPGGKQGTYIPFPDPAAGSIAAGSDIHPLQVSDGVDRIIRFNIVSVGAGTAGITFVSIIYSAPAVQTVTQ